MLKWAKVVLGQTARPFGHPILRTDNPIDLMFDHAIIDASFGTITRKLLAI
jgi:hypothetical protein